MRNPRLICVLLMLVASGCGSGSEPTSEEAPALEATAQDARASQRAADAGLWAPYAAGREQALPPGILDSVRADPDAVLARHRQECAKGAASPSCQTLRVAVEYVLLDALVGLRDIGEPLERRWLQAAARAQTPQLACFGLRGLLVAEERSGEDEALIAAALDSLWRAPRNVVLAYGASAPGMSEMLGRTSRERGQPGSGPELCIDGSRDPQPNPGLSGRYPGAHYRPFASTSTRRWFTTPDPLEKVLAFFAHQGKPALTADGLKAAQIAKVTELTSQLTMSSEPISDAKMAKYTRELMDIQGTDWSAPFSRLEGTGEIRYVMITPKQAVAVFWDDMLHATSIVATPPTSPTTLDIEQQKRDLFARAVYGF